MALPTQLINLPFTSGVDTKTDEKLSAKPAVLENATFKGGTILKRYGAPAVTNSVDSGGSQSSGGTLFPFGAGLSRINGGIAYSLGDQQNNWTTKPGVGALFTHSLQQIVRNSSTQTGADHAYASGITVTAWADTSVRVAVYDETTGDFYQTGATPVAGTSGGTYGGTRCVVLGEVVLVFFVETGSGVLHVAIVNTNTPESLPVKIQLETDVQTGELQAFDAVAYSGGYAIVAYVDSQATPHIQLIAVSAAGAVLSSPGKTDRGAAATDCHLASVLVDSNGVGYVLNFQTEADYLAFNPQTFAQVKALTQIIAAGLYVRGAMVESSAGHVSVFLSSNGGGTPAGHAGIFIQYAVVTSSAISSAAASIPGTGGLTINSAGFILNSSPCVVMRNDGYFSDTSGTGSVQPTSWVVNSSGQVLAKILPSLSPPQTTSRARAFAAPSGATALLVSEMGTLSLFVSGATGGTVTNTTTIGITRVNIAPATAGNAPVAQIGGAVYVGGSQPKVFDGQQLTDAGHNIFPEGVGLVLSGGGQLSAGIYAYVAVFCWLDSAGEVQRSAPSPPTEATASAMDKAVITVPTQRLSANRDGSGISKTWIEIYRTEANGVLSYRITSPAALLLNNSATSTVSYTDDSVSDGDLVSNAILYTTGGVFENIAPPAYSVSCEHKNRLIIAGLENPYAWRSSAEHVENQMLSFNESWGGLVTATTGAITGLASMDGNLVILTSGAGYLVQGDGPNVLGQNNWPPAQRITGVDEGPVSWRSVVSSPFGIFFQNTRGFWLLGRSLSCEYIGADVEEFGKYIVRSAVVVPAQNQVRYQVDLGSDMAGALNGGMTTGNGGLCLVYDYFYRQWSVFQNYGAVGACLYGGKYTRVQSGGAALREQPGTWGDGYAAVQTVAETPWIKTANIQGFQRVRRMELLGTYASDCTIRVSIAYDYSETFTDVSDFVGNGVLSPGGVLQFRKLLAKQKCEAIKFRFEDLNISGSGEGMALTGLTLEVGVKGGPYRLPASQST